MVDDKTGSSSGGFFDMLALDIIDLYLLIAPTLGVPGSQSAGFLKYPVRQLFSLCLYYHVGPGDALGVEPPVSAAGDFEGDLLVLVVVFSYIDMKAIGGKIVEGAALRRR